MADYGEYLDIAVPNRLSIVFLDDGHGMQPRRLESVMVTYRVL